MSASQLESLSRHTVVVADTGDVAAIARLHPRDATTNPSLILKAAQRPEYAPLIRRACETTRASTIADAVDAVLVEFGSGILEHIPGRVSTEVDARLSFDNAATIERARRISQAYARRGIASSRVLIKIAATWEGIQAAATLEREGIHCNLTLLFALAQAEACAAAGVTLISPFVGRILDWHRQRAGAAWDAAANAGDRDPGVQSVRAIYERLKSAGARTEIMGASFRNVGQILALAGCDLLTISPELLDQLASASGDVERALTPPEVRPTSITLSEAEFRYRLNEDAMATEKLAEGIRLFVQDTLRLEALLGPYIAG